MARKDLLKGLMDAPEVQPKGETRVDAARPRYTKGAIGAVSRSIADLKSRSISEIDPRMIDRAGLKDRLYTDKSDHDALVQSIRDYGQQVPVLVRPNPNDPERYQIVYGRRRVAALKELGLPIKAMVRVLDDQELVMAQGQENSARKDLTFIEKANFVRQMNKAGYDRKTMCDALHMDKTLISRMISVADRIPIDVIEAIGSAPSVGRDRWLAFADLMPKGDADLVKTAVKAESSSDKRFDAAMAVLKPKRPALPRAAPTTVKSATGQQIAKLDRKAGKTIFTIQQKMADGFDDWLAENLSEIHRDWFNSREE